MPLDNRPNPNTPTTLAGEGGAAGPGPLLVHRSYLEDGLGGGQGFRPRPAEEAAGLPLDGERGVGPLRRRLGAGIVGETRTHMHTHIHMHTHTRVC